MAQILTRVHLAHVVFAVPLGKLCHLASHPVAFSEGMQSVSTRSKVGFSAAYFSSEILCQPLYFKKMCNFGLILLFNQKNCFPTKTSDYFPRMFPKNIKMQDASRLPSKIGVVGTSPSPQSLDT